MRSAERGGADTSGGGKAAGYADGDPLFRAVTMGVPDKGTLRQDAAVHALA